MEDKCKEKEETLVVWRWLEKKNGRFVKEETDHENSKIYDMSKMSKGEGKKGRIKQIKSKMIFLKMKNKSLLALELILKIFCEKKYYNVNYTMHCISHLSQIIYVNEYFLLLKSTQKSIRLSKPGKLQIHIAKITMKLLMINEGRNLF